MSQAGPSRGTVTNASGTNSATRDENKNPTNQRVKLRRKWSTPDTLSKIDSPKDTPVTLKCEVKEEDITYSNVDSNLDTVKTVNEKQKADIVDGIKKPGRDSLKSLKNAKQTKNDDTLEDLPEQMVDESPKETANKSPNERKELVEDSVNIIENKLDAVSEDIQDEETDNEMKIIGNSSVNDKDVIDFVEDEEVLKIMGNFDHDLDEIEEFEPEENVDHLEDVSDDEIVGEELMTPRDNHKRIEKPKPATSNEEPKKELKGLVDHGPYSRILLVGDSRFEQLEKMWPLWHYIKPQILVEPNLKIEGLKDFILSQTEVPELENGTLLVCSVGINDIIKFTDHEYCKTLGDHTPMKVMDLSLKVTEDVIRLVMLRLKRAYVILEELLDSSSVICFTAIIPCDPLLYYEMAFQGHEGKGHVLVTPAMKSKLDVLKDKIKVVCERVNKRLGRLSPLPSLWDIMANYHHDRKDKPIFIDGLRLAGEPVTQLTRRLGSFLQELFYGIQIKNRIIEFHHKQEVIVVGDSRMEEIKKMWNGDEPKFICKPNLGFYNFTEFIEKNLVGLNNKIVLVCLGMNDLIKFVDDDEFPCENHAQVKKAISLCHKYNKTPESYVSKVSKSMLQSFQAFVERNSSIMIFATVYPLHLDMYLKYQLQLHKENTGHAINPPDSNPSCDKDLMKAVITLNRHIESISYKLFAPVWDMRRTVCRGNDESAKHKDVLTDGIFPSERTSEELVRSFHSFLNEKLKQESKEKPEAYRYLFRPQLKEKRFSTIGAVSKPREAEKEAIRSTIAHHSHASQFSEESKSVNKKPEFNLSSLPANKHLRNSGSSPSTKARIPVFQRLSSPPAKAVYRKQSRSPERRSSRFFPRSPERLLEPGPSQNRAHSFRLSRSPEKTLAQRFSRSPGRHRRPSFSRSPDSYKPNKLSTFDILYQLSRSPDKSQVSKLPFPETGDWSNKYLQYSKGSISSCNQGFNENRSQYSSNARVNPVSQFTVNPVPQFTVNPISQFEDSVSKIKSDCRRERDPLIRNGLLDLCETHVRECDLYLKKPDAYPVYNKEYRIFVEKKRSFFAEIGGNSADYDYITAWHHYWPKRMFELFEESWTTKKQQYLKMVRNRKKRSPSSESSSGSHKRRRNSKSKFSLQRKDHTVDSKRRDKLVKKERKRENLVNERKRENLVSEQRRENLVDEQRRENLVNEQRRENLVNEQRRENLVNEQRRENLVNEQRRENLVNEQRRENLVNEQRSENLVNNEWKRANFVNNERGRKNLVTYERQTSQPKQDDDILVQNKKSKCESQTAERLSADLITGLMKAPTERTKTKSVNIVEVFGILTYMKDKLGAVGMLVNVLYEKALSLEKSGQDPHQVLEDKTTASLLGLVTKKLSNLIEEEDVSAIQKAIYLEAQSLLEDLVRNVETVEEKSATVSQKICINISHLASMAMGKSIHETIEVIERFLLYDGHTDVPREKIEAIYLAVKDEQLKLNNSSSKHQRTEVAVEKHSQSLRLSDRTSFPSSSELTEEFFIGKKAHSKAETCVPTKELYNMGMNSKPSSSFSSVSSSYPRVSLSDPPSLIHQGGLMPSSSRFHSLTNYDEEFFTGSKFLKPNVEDEEGNSSAGRYIVHSGKDKDRFYVPRKHILPPAPPVISGMRITRSPPKLPVDFDALKKILDDINNLQ